MKHISVVIMVLVLIGWMTHDFFDRVYQTVTVKDFSAPPVAEFELAENKQVPEYVQQVLQHWGLDEAVSMDEDTGSRAVDTGTIGNYQVSLLAIYAQNNVRTAVLTVVVDLEQPRQLLKLKAGEQWQGLHLRAIEARRVELSYDTTTLSLRLFDATSQSEQG